MKALISGLVIAEAPAADVVEVEGNAYFPPTSLVDGTLKDSPTPYTCPWKGAAQYHDLVVAGNIIKDGAWSYPALMQAAILIVGRDFSGFVAFDRQQVTIVD